MIGRALIVALAKGGGSILPSALPAFSFSTVAYAVWGLLTLADYFDNDSVLVLPTVAVAFLAAFFAGFHTLISLITFVRSRPPLPSVPEGQGP